MKPARILLITVSILVLLVLLFERHMTASGCNHQMRILQSILPGQSEEVVTSLFENTPLKIQANSKPNWLSSVVTTTQEGYFLVFYAGFPSRNIIVHFNKDNIVTYATWCNT